jgi:hypothetical protein
MKQGQSERMTYRSSGPWWAHPPTARGSHCHTARPQPSSIVRGDLDQTESWSLATLVLTLLRASWFVLVTPFRLAFSMIAWLGRLTALVVGFSLMVVGMAFLAGPFFWLGIPLFIVGLVLTLRCLD